MAGESLRAVARSHGVQPVQIRNWRRQRNVLSASSKTKRSISKGRPSTIKHLEERIIGWALEMRQRGVPIKYKHLQIKACREDDNFRGKTTQQQYHMIRRLCKANCLVPRRGTHQAQEQPQVAIDEALEWLLETRPVVSAPNVDRKYILNMDQTPLNFSLQDGSTLNLAGERTVTVRGTGGGRDRTTVCLGVAADGSKLKPMMIFKGNPTGTIARRELPENPNRDDIALVCQPNAYQDEANMLQWIELCLAPYVADKPEGVPCILFLDQFSAHQTDAVKARLEELGVELRLIPGGCTWLVQPIDVGIGKPFKDRCRSFWWEWMIGPSERDAVVDRASREEQSNWVNQAWQAFPEDIIRNSWLKTGLSYFT